MDLQSWGWVGLLPPVKSRDSRHLGAIVKKNLSTVSDIQFFALYVILLHLELCGTQPMETVIVRGSLSQENMGVCYLSCEHYLQSELPICTRPMSHLNWFHHLMGFQQAIHNTHSCSGSQSLGFLNIILRKGAFYLFLYCTVNRAGSFTWNILRTQLSHFQLSAGQGSEGHSFSCYAQSSGQWPKSLALAVPFLLKGRILQGGEKTIIGSNLRILRNSLRFTMSGITEYRLYWTENLIFFVRFLPIHHGLCSEPAGVHYVCFWLRMMEG